MHTMYLSNTLAFDEYISINYRRINEAEQAKLSPESTDMDLTSYIDMFNSYNVVKGPQASCLQATSSFICLPNGQLYNLNSKVIKPWMNKGQSCELQLIGTPEDVEDLSRFPGVLIRDVFDDTQSFFVFDEDYSYPELQSSMIFNIFDVLREPYLNPDERIYSIYIQMSDELIKSIYGKSNFFFAADKSKQKRMSIKNFIKYIDIIKHLS